MREWIARVDRTRGKDWAPPTKGSGGKKVTDACEGGEEFG